MKKNGSVDVTFARAIMHQKHLAQSGRSTQSAVDIFNTLRVFPKEPIRKQEIELECMNAFYNFITSIPFFLFVQIAIMKYILVSGGVISGIGKGVIASSLGTLLKACGLRVTSIKIDPYLNIDAGTFSPYEHGKLIG